MSFSCVRALVALAVAVPGLLAADLGVAGPLIGVTFTSTPASDGSGLTSPFAGQAGVTLLSFNAPTYALGQTTINAGGASIFGDGAIVTGNLSGQYAAPAGDGTQYLTLAFGKPVGTETIQFTTPVNYFGFYWGSEDAYNTIAFHLQGGLDVTLSGSDVAAMHNADGNQVSGDTNRYTNFFTTDSSHLITGITLHTDQYAMESDNWAFGTVPEPAALTLLAGGLGGMLLLRRRVPVGRPVG